VTIQREEETSAKSIPRASTLNFMETPGSTSTREYTISVPPRTAGTMEATMPSFMKPARKVADSLRFGFLPKTIIRNEANNEVATANRGLMDKIVSTSYLEPKGAVFRLKNHPNGHLNHKRRYYLPEKSISETENQGFLCSKNFVPGSIEASIGTKSNSVTL